MSAADEFTRANVIYLNALRHPHKTGSAFEGYRPKPRSGWLLVGLGVAVVLIAITVGKM